jgi:adenylate kinase family enzyme
MSTLVLFGRPASGKGTLSQHLSDACGYRACSTGQAMRAWAAGPSAEQAALRATMARGDYGSDELAVRIVRTFIDTLPDHVPGVILDGFPRDLAQLTSWLAIPADHGAAIVVDTPAGVCRHRVLGRMICPACGWTDHQPETTCLRCGTALQRRTDDRDEAAFARRLHDYDTRVVPIIEAWSHAGLPIRRIDGTLDEDELTLEAARMLHSLAPSLAIA